MNTARNINQSTENILIDNLQVPETGVSDREMEAIEGGWIWVSHFKRAPDYYYTKTTQYILHFALPEKNIS